MSDPETGISLENEIRDATPATPLPGIHGQPMKILLRKDGKFAKGMVPPKSPGGIRRSPLDELFKELARVEREQKVSFLRHRWRDAFANRHTATDMMQYIMPKPRPTDAGESPDLTLTGPTHITLIQHQQNDLTLHHNGSPPRDARSP